jgi:hypothetical protein
MKNQKIILIIFFFLIIKTHFGQTPLDTMLVFNHKAPVMNNGQAVYCLKDILLSDTLMTNMPDLKILSFYCATKCIGEDTQCISKNGLINGTIKAYFKRCITYFPSKIFFEEIEAIDKNGNKIILHRKAITIYKKE